ncbi:MAG TPA: outer-membrane lipoprotein carrier protein LolA [Terriglobia bacterium]|nr:outer-membrane lipoprotein carrier protein LolA [Terriglobia bacterium]
MYGFALLLLFLHLLPLPQSRDLAPHELFDKVSDLYGRMDSFSADFEQIQKDANRTYTLRGHVYLKKGRRARFDYVFPSEQVDYFDGKTHTRYEPSQKQARVQSMGRSDDERLLIFLILGNRESPWKNEFREKGLGRDRPRIPGNQVLNLIPNNQKTIREITVEVNPSTFLIHRFAFTRADSSYTEYMFTDMKTTPLPESLFKFKAPPDVEIFER